MKRLGKIINVINGINTVGAAATGIIVIFLTVSVSFSVFTRYFLGFTIKGTLDIWGFCIVYMTFLSAAWVLKREKHVAIDIITTRLKARTQLMVNSITSILCGVVSLIFTWYSVEVIWADFQSGCLITSELLFPRYLIMMIFPPGFLLLGIQFLLRAYGFMKSFKGAVVLGEGGGPGEKMAGL